MKTVIVIDSFKGSLTSMEAGNAARVGILKADPEAEVVVKPLADGGEGTVEALVTGMGGKMRSAVVTGPLGSPVRCEYGILPGNNTAIIEMSGAAGITLIPKEKRNPLKTTTYGVGEVIKDALENGCRRFIIGIGGSATNDGGTGMLKALGYEFMDADGKEIPLGAEGLANLSAIDDRNALPELADSKFQIACDVTNPLCGERGCSAIFGPQKGATVEMIADMDRWLENYAKLCKIKYQDADEEWPGTGAAGGLGFAFRTFLNAKLESGIQLILKETRLEEEIRTADLVITGEGRLDAQTAMGKAPIGVARLAKKYDKTVIALAGSVTAEAGVCNENGIDAFFSILRRIQTQEEAMEKENAEANLAAAAEQVYRLVHTKFTFPAQK